MFHPASKRSYKLLPLFVALFLFLIGATQVSTAAASAPSIAIGDRAELSSSANRSNLTTDAAAKVVLGRVQTNNQQPVSHALVTAWRRGHDKRVSTFTNANGDYRMKLAPGKWAVTVSPTDQSEPANWIYPFRPKEAKFRRHDRPEVRRVNFTVLTVDASISGKVTLPDGGPPSFPVIVKLRHARGFEISVQTNIDSGKFSTRLLHGTYRISVHPRSDRYVGPPLEPITLNHGQSLDLGTIVLVAVSDRPWPR